MVVCTMSRFRIYSVSSAEFGRRRYKVAHAIAVPARRGRISAVRPDDDLDATILLVAECLVRFGSLFQSNAVGNKE